ncbi:MAG: hypothetical protein HUU20_27340 [Pirellulales bacterium]|nr:hypothetical protein [Pirellulales bacterium]
MVKNVFVAAVCLGILLSAMGTAWAGSGTGQQQTQSQSQEQSQLQTQQCQRTSDPDCEYHHWYYSFEQFLQWMWGGEHDE